VKGVEAREGPSGDRGLFATRTLSPGEVIMQLPENILITGQSARAVPHVAAVLRAVEEDRLEDSLDELANCDKDTVAMVLFLLAEAVKDNGSFRPWIDSLPKQFYTPITVPEATIESKLRGSFVLTFALEVRAELQTLYEQFIVPYAIERFEHAYPMEKTTFELFIWAYSVSESRAFEMGHTEQDGLGDTNKGSLLTPYADMMNHVCGSSAVSAFVRRWKHDDSSCAGVESGFEVCIGSSAVLQGDEILISYGLLDNARLLLHYGFSVMNNPHDHVKLSLAAPEDECVELVTKKLLLLELCQTGPLGTEHELRVSDPLPTELLSSLRLLLMTREEAESVTIRTNFSLPMSPRNEKAVLEFLEGILNMLSTTSDETTKADEKALRGLAAFERYCEIYMLSLQSIISKAQERLNCLQIVG
jgi:hypothetical protein